MVILKELLNFTIESHQSSSSPFRHRMHGAEWAKDEKLRQQSFLGLRYDKKPLECQRRDVTAKRGLGDCVSRGDLLAGGAIS